MNGEQYYRSIDPEAFTVGEIWTGNSTVKKYVETNTELDSAFNFDLADALLKSVKDGNSTVLRFVLQSTLKDFPEQDNSNFITNHDQNRVMSQFMGDEGKAKGRGWSLVDRAWHPIHLLRRRDRHERSQAG